MIINDRFTVRNLTKAGFIRRNDLNFADDGARFQVFEFEGMFVSYTKYEDEYFLAIRPDYCNEPTSFTLNEWMQTDEYKLQNEFNGVYAIDVDKLIENIRKINAKRAELNAACDAEAKATTKENAEFILARLSEELTIVSDAIAYAKKLDWLNASPYVIAQVKSTVTSLNNYGVRLSELVKRITSCEAGNVELLVVAKRIKQNGYYIVNNNSFYVKNVHELVG